MLLMGLERYQVRYTFTEQALSVVKLLGGVAFAKAYFWCISQNYANEVYLLKWLTPHFHMQDFGYLISMLNSFMSSCLTLQHAQSSTLRNSSAWLYSRPLSAVGIMHDL
jgi:hypothetical protein